MPKAVLHQCCAIGNRFVAKLTQPHTFRRSPFVVVLALIQAFFGLTLADECELTQVIHKVQYPGCEDKIIGSYACVGRCTSYVKVVSLKLPI